MKKEEMFTSLCQIAQMIAETFGPNCETVIHDCEHYENFIAAIYNGHVSGRTVGSTLDILGTTRELDQEAVSSDLVNLLATTPSGQQVKSSTFYLNGEDYSLALGINFDFSSLVTANRILVDLMNAQADLQSALWQGSDSGIAELFDECLATLGKSVNALNKQDRLQLIALLDQHNAFSYRKSVPFVAKHLNVSRYTVYKYLSELTEQGGQEGE